MVTGGEWTSGTISWDNMPAAETLLQENISHNNLTKYQFSCLTAVRHWYDGDITGQNENYGVMIRYYDETIADYNSVFSADYTVATQRPTMRISYNPLKRTINEGTTITLPAPDTTEEITWVSSNTAVATVTSSGCVTAIKVGNTTVSASVGGEIVKEYFVDVIVADGVYYIKNKSTNRYLGTAGSTLERTSASLYVKYTSDINQLRQLWKIAYLGNGYYSIRPMYMQSMGLHATSNNVDITTIGTKNSLSVIPMVNCWGIEHTPDGYVFKHVNTGSLAMKAIISYPSYPVTTAVFSSSTPEFFWELEKETSVTKQALLLDSQTGATIDGGTQYIEYGESRSLTDLGITASFVCAYCINQSISWISRAPSVVSVNSETGAVTGLTAGGTTTIVAKYMHNGIEYEKNYKVQVLSIDPFEPENIEYMRQMRITGTSIISGDTDHSITVIKSTCSTDPFFTVTDNINNQISRCYVISSELKSRLNTLESGYQDGYNVLPFFDTSTDAEKAAHAAKEETDQLVDEGYFFSDSNEYYGVWAYNYTSMCNLGALWEAAIDTATKAYNVYIAISSFYYSWLATTSTNVVYISASQYDDVATYIDDFDNAAYDINFSGISFVSAEERNLALAEQGYKTPLPYKEGTPVLVGKVSNCSSDVYVRVYTEGTTTQNGRWFMRYSDIQGLTAEEIRGKFALGDRAPTHYSFVTVPEGKTVFVGVVNESTIEGTIQFEILERAEIGWYGEIIELP